MPANDQTLIASLDENKLAGERNPIRSAVDIRGVILSQLSGNPVGCQPHGFVSRPGVVVLFHRGGGDAFSTSPEITDLENHEIRTQ